MLAICSRLLATTSAQEALRLYAEVRATALSYAELPEAKDANALLADIKGNPERLAKACDQMNDRTAAMYMALADSWSKKGQDAEAVSCLKKVMALCPNTRHADVAQAESTKLQGKNNPAIPTGFTKP